MIIEKNTVKKDIKETQTKVLITQLQSVLQQELKFP